MLPWSWLTNRSPPNAGRVRPRLSEKRDVYVYFNNDACEYAVQNALRLQEPLSRKPSKA